MNLLVARKTPVLFATSAAHAIPGLSGPLRIARDAAAILVVSVRRIERGRADAMLGAHIMSPSYRPTDAIEARVMEILGGIGIDVPPSHRVPGAIALPPGLAGISIPIVTLTFSAGVGLDRLAAAGAALATLRDEGVVLVGIAHDEAVAFGGPQMLATVTMLLGATTDDDRLAELGGRGGGVGFVLAPDLDDAVSDDGCCFMNVEAAGELPYEVIDQLRAYLPEGETGENHWMAKKSDASIHITRFDKTRLMNLLRSLDSPEDVREEIEDLEQELERGTEVDSVEIAPDVVTMNSTVRVTDLDAGTTHLYTIVFPADADFDAGRISILSPIGTALLGYRAGDVVTWEMPRGTRRLRIDALEYQPEAAGDFHL